LRGRAYRSFADIVRESALAVGVSRANAESLLDRWGEFDPWPDVPEALARLAGTRTFVVTNCSIELGRRAAARAGHFDLIVTAEEAHAYKPDPRPYRRALETLGLDASATLFVAGSAHDVGGAARVGMDVYWANRGRAPAPADGVAIRVEMDLHALRTVMEDDRVRS
jgi:2-haloalkanoic acid dehalogenase type II